MKRQSYKIKHDFLFSNDDNSIDVPKFDTAISEAYELKLSDALKAKDEDSFRNLVDTSMSNIIIRDDIGKCFNPSSERYKQFIVRCIYHILVEQKINVYF